MFSLTKNDLSPAATAINNRYIKQVVVKWERGERQRRESERKRNDASVGW